MKAVVQDRYGPPEVLRVEEVERPVPGDDQVLVRIHASTVTQTDTHARAARPFIWRFFAGLRRPKWRTLGVELAGEVEAVGAAVTEFKVGDHVFGSAPGFGAHAEFICLRERGPLAHKPAGISFEEAAAVCDGGIQALATLRAADVREGQRIVIYGASGSLGTAAVQLARHFGAHVTAVCNTKNVELVRSLGADEVVDYTQEDFRKIGGKYDAIIDAVGKYTFLRARRALRPAGVYVPTDLGPLMLETIGMVLATRWVGSKRVKFAMARQNRDDVLLLKELIEAGRYRAVIDRSYPLEQVVEAHRYVETWQKTGNVVLAIGDSGPQVPRPAPEQTMRAVVHDRYGGPDVLRLEEVERPTPGDDEVLVRIHATTVTRTDCGLRSADYVISRLFTGLLRPKRKVLGFELAGEVEAVGAAVTEFEAGDHVFGVKGFAAHAEFACIRETAPLAHMPIGMSFEEAAAVCDGAALAMACLRKADLGEGRSILIYGASGSVGTAAVQLARHYGLDVTAVCSTKSLELVRSLGADRVIDYTQTDFTKNGETYDVILDAVGKHSFWRCRGSLKPGGIYIGTDGLRNLFLAPLARWIGNKRVALGITKYSKQDVRFLKELIEAGRYRAVIDRRYPLEQVIDATRYVETGQKTGNVVLTVGHDARGAPR